MPCFLIFGDVSRMKTEELNITGVARFSGDLSGPSIVILGGVHGDEPCGVFAVETLLSMLTNGELTLTRGTLTLITANLEALAHNKRFIESNLNRLFKDNAGTPDGSEVRRAEELKPLLANTDYVLDLHSTSQPSPAFIVCEAGDRTFAEMLGIKWVVTGWAALDPALEGDTCTWANKHGAQAVTLECGQHTDPSAPVVALSAAVQALSALGMIETPAIKQQKEPPQFLALYHAHILSQRGFVYARAFRGFDPIAEGELIGADANGEYRAPRAGRIVFPADPTRIPLNTELYMLGHEM